MTCDYLEYDGTKKLAKAWGSVTNRGDVELKTDTLYLDRENSEAYYNTFGTILDEQTKLTSNRGIYFMNFKNTDLFPT